MVEVLESWIESCAGISKVSVDDVCFSLHRFKQKSLDCQCAQATTIV